MVYQTFRQKSDFFDSGSLRFKSEVMLTFFKGITSNGVNLQVILRMESFICINHYVSNLRIFCILSINQSLTLDLRIYVLKVGQTQCGILQTETSSKLSPFFCRKKIKTSAERIVTKKLRSINFTINTFEIEFKSI